jgi:hypothetical protein
MKLAVLSLLKAAMNARFAMPLLLFNKARETIDGTLLSQQASSTPVHSDNDNTGVALKQRGCIAQGFRSSGFLEPKRIHRINSFMTAHSY